MRSRFLPGISLLVAIAAVIWGVGMREARNRYQAALEAGYQRAFYDLIDQVEQLQVVTGKALTAASAEQQIAHLAEIGFRAGAAQDALSRLPLKGINTSASRKFLAQMGDYANTLIRDRARGRELGAQERQQLARFEVETARLSRQLHGLESRLAGRGFRWAIATTTGIGRGTGMAQPRPVPGTASDLNAFSTMEERMQKLPALIYDGPFSDHREKERPRGLTGAPVSRERAAEIARRFVDLPAGAVYQPAGRPRDTSGRIAAFSVVLQQRNGAGQIYADVSRKGGHVVWYLNSRPVAAERLDTPAALDRARRFLESRGFRNMEAIQSAREDHALVFSFAPRQDGVLIYPDLVRVKVALDDGQVIGFDARQYLMAHHDRRLPQPRLSPDEARARANHGMDVQGVRLAVIPTAGGGEALAYEIRAKRGADAYLIFVNALTGREEDILKVVSAGGGRLTM